MIDFPIQSECKTCPLCDSADSPGIPTRRFQWSGQECDFEVRHKKAILFVGQGPGYNEDKQGRGWVGYAGGLLEKFIELSGIHTYADVYLSNAVRCKTPQNAIPTDGQVNICRQYMDKDLALLRQHYEEIILVGCGAKGAKSVGGHRSLGGALRRQGLPGIWPDVPCFYTNNPAILHPDRKPALVSSIEDHFRLIVRYLKGEFIPNDLSIEPLVGHPVPQEISGHIVTFDIETYGILMGKHQSVFNPHKSLLIDGVPFKDQVVTCAFGWRDPVGKLKTAVYRMDKPQHRILVRKWFQFMVENGITAVGQNTKFDLQYLRAFDPSLRYWISPQRLKVDDTMLVSFLEYEQRPERGLKELATLLGITDYNSSGVTGKEGNAKGYGDPELLRYNCRDAAVTYILYEEMSARILQKYGKKSAKNSQLCADMRNMVTWCVAELEKNGSTLVMDQLKKVDMNYRLRRSVATKTAEEEYGIKLFGKGSDKPLREFFLAAIEEAGLTEDPRIEWTKTGLLGIGVANSNLLLKYIDSGRTYEILKLFQEYKDCAKIVNTYTRPLLTEKRRGIVKSDRGVGFVYPSWYSIPSYSNRGGNRDDKAMGQIQGRFSVSAPARHTEPKSIRGCSCSRFPGGTLAEYDMSQDHLRMAALLSNDPVLYSAYTTPGQSLHAMTAEDIFPDVEIVKGSDEYQLGKTLNFLVLFKGGADTYVQTARKDVGIEIKREFARMAIETWYKIHPVFKEWQDGQIGEASGKGYIEVLTGWSRSFMLGKSGVQSSVNEISNCAIQTLCAQCTQSAQFEIMKELLRSQMRSLICLQIHDSVFVDTYPGEEEEVDRIVKKHMERPPVLLALEDNLLRTIPFVCEKKVYQVVA